MTSDPRKSPFASASGLPGRPMEVGRWIDALPSPYRITALAAHPRAANVFHEGRSRGDESWTDGSRLISVYRAETTITVPSVVSGTKMRSPRSSRWKSAAVPDPLPGSRMRGFSPSASIFHTAPVSKLDT